MLQDLLRCVLCYCPNKSVNILQSCPVRSAHNVPWQTVSSNLVLCAQHTMFPDRMPWSTATIFKLLQRCGDLDSHNEAQKIYKRHSLEFIKLIRKQGWRNATQRSLSTWIYTKLVKYLLAIRKFIFVVLLINYKMAKIQSKHNYIY